MKSDNGSIAPWASVHTLRSPHSREQLSISDPVELLRTGALRAARLLVAQETHLPDDVPAAALIAAAVERLAGAEPIDDPRERLLVMAITHLLLQVPSGPDRDRLTDVVEELVGRCPGHLL